MIATYRGIIRDGKVELTGVALPEGAEVVVVVETHLTLSEQRLRYDALSDEEWRAPFLAYQRITADEPAEVQDSELSDESLNALVHDSRAE